MSEISINGHQAEITGSYSALAHAIDESKIDFLDRVPRFVPNWLPKVDPAVKTIIDRSNLSGYPIHAAELRCTDFLLLFLMKFFCFAVYVNNLCSTPARCQVYKPSQQANVGDVCAPHLVGAINRHASEQVRINLVLRVPSAGFWPRRHTRKT